MVRGLIVLWLVAGAWVLHAGTQQGDDAMLEGARSAVARANLAALDRRVTVLEEARIVERITVLETLADRAASNQTLLYGVLGGVAIQLIVSALNLKKRTG